MARKDGTAVTVLGLGVMGSALATAPGRRGARDHRVEPLTGPSTEVIAPVHALIRRQIAAGHGKAGIARIYEEIRRPA
jgi:hypothetical protein